MSTTTEKRSVNPFIWVFSRIRSIIGGAVFVVWTFVCAWFVMLAGFLGVRDIATELIRGWAQLVLMMFGIGVDVKGEENIPSSGGGIVVFNHQSHFDIPVLCYSTRKHIRFGAKIELFKIPLFGPAMRAVGTLPIARENRHEVMRIYKEAEEKFRQNFLFVLAPEGTRQKEPRIGPFKKGPFVFAINAGVPLIPAVIRGAYEVLPKKSLGVNLDALSRTISIEYLPPVPTTGLSPKEVDGLTQRVREMMVAAYDRAN